MRVTRGTMEPTRTFQRRWWRFIELDNLPVDGVVMLGQQEEKGGKVQEDDYGIDEQPATTFGYRRFVCRKLGAAIGGDDEMYVVQIGARASSCNCKAGSTRNEVCRHRDGIKALIEAGVLPVRELQGA